MNSNGAASRVPLALPDDEGRTPYLSTGRGLILQVSPLAQQMSPRNSDPEIPEEEQAREEQHQQHHQHHHHQQHHQQQQQRKEEQDKPHPSSLDFISPTSVTTFAGSKSSKKRKRMKTRKSLKKSNSDDSTDTINAAQQGEPEPIELKQPSPRYASGIHHVAERAGIEGDARNADESSLEKKMQKELDDSLRLEEARLRSSYLSQKVRMTRTRTTTTTTTTTTTEPMQNGRQNHFVGNNENDDDDDDCYGLDIPESEKEHVSRLRATLKQDQFEHPTPGYISHIMQDDRTVSTTTLEASRTTLDLSGRTSLEHSRRTLDRSGRTSLGPSRRGSILDQSGRLFDSSGRSSPRRPLGSRLEAHELSPFKPTTPTGRLGRSPMRRESLDPVIRSGNRIRFRPIPPEDSLSSLDEMFEPPVLPQDDLQQDPGASEDFGWNQFTVHEPIEDFLGDSTGETNTCSSNQDSTRDMVIGFSRRRASGSSAVVMSDLPWQSDRSSGARVDDSIGRKLSCSIWGDHRCHAMILVLVIVTVATTLLTVLLPRERFVHAPAPTVILGRSIAPSTTPPTEVKNVTLSLTFDDFPGETYWGLTGPCGQIIGVEAGGYNRTYLGETISLRFTLPLSSLGQNYVFYIGDTKGDGLCCQNRGKATLTLDEDESVLFTTEGNFGSVATGSFVVPPVRSTERISCSPTLTPSRGPTTQRPSSLAQLELSSALQPLVLVGLCLEAPGAKVTNGVVLRLGNCTNAENQQWRFTKDGTVVSATMDETLCVESLRAAIGSPVQLLRCQTGFVLQQITPELNNGILRIGDVKNNFCLGVDAFSGQLETQSCTIGAANQEWAFDWFHPSATPSSTAVPTLSPTSLQSTLQVIKIGGLCVKVPALILLERDPVVLMGCNGQLDEMWQLSESGTIANGRNTTFCMAISQEQGSPILVQHCDPYSSLQVFMLDELNRFRSASNGNLCLAPDELLLPVSGVSQGIFALPCSLSPSQFLDVSPAVETTQPGEERVPSVAPPFPRVPTFTAQPTNTGSDPLIRQAELVISFDLFPNEIAWRLSGPCGIVAEVPPGHYQSYLRREIATETFSLSVGHSYALDLLDIGDNGLSKPFGRVYLVVEEPDGTKRLVFHEWGNFGRSLLKEFVVSGSPVPLNC